MSLKITLHKGAGEIGGTCLELFADNTKIVLDAGKPLSENSKPAKLNKINPDAILISHPHMDHYGLIEKLKSTPDIYIGETAFNLINAARTFCNKKSFEGNFKFFNKDKFLKVGPFKITPYLMDHSAVDAYSFFIETKYGNIFYSGDFRAHGRKSFLLDRLEQNPPKNVNCLFIEGTMLGRKTEDVPTEEDLEKEIIEILRKQKNVSFLFSSAQNIDRIVSAYDACVATDKVFVIDVYTAWVLENIKKISKRVPNIDWDRVRVLFFANHCKHAFEKNKFPSSFKSKIQKIRIRTKELKENPSKYLIQLSTGLATYINNFKSESNKPNIIYSQWMGYLERDDYKKQYWKIRKVIDAGIANFHYAHTSGHAKIEDLKRLVDAINPKHVVPVHTENPDEYLKITKKVLKIENEKQITLNGGKIYV